MWRERRAQRNANAARVSLVSLLWLCVVQESKASDAKCHLWGRGTDNTCPSGELQGPVANINLHCREAEEAAEPQSNNLLLLRVSGRWLVIKQQLLLVFDQRCTFTENLFTTNLFLSWTMTLQIKRMEGEEGFETFWCPFFQIEEGTVVQLSAPGNQSSTHSWTANCSLWMQNKSQPHQPVSGLPPTWQTRTMPPFPLSQAAKTEIQEGYF